MSNRPGRKIARQRANTRTHPGARSSFWAAPANRLVVGGALLLFAVVVVVALIASGDDDSADDGFEMNGEPLPTLVAGEPDVAIGLKAPLVVSEDLDGDRVVMGGGGGPNDTAKLVVFVAHWCPTCQAEVPELAERLAETPLPEGVEVIAVSTFEDASRDNHPPSDWFASVDWPASVLVDTDNADIAAAFGVSSVPGWVVLDNRNTVVTRAVGGLDITQIDALIGAAAATMA